VIWGWRLSLHEIIKHSSTEFCLLSLTKSIIIIVPFTSNTNKEQRGRTYPKYYEKYQMKDHTEIVMCGLRPKNHSSVGGLTWIIIFSPVPRSFLNVNRWLQCSYAWKPISFWHIREKDLICIVTCNTKQFIKSHQNDKLGKSQRPPLHY